MKQRYEKPALQVVELRNMSPFMNPVSQTGEGGSGGFDVKGEVTSKPVSKNYNVWDDDWSE